MKLVRPGEEYNDQVSPTSVPRCRWGPLVFRGLWTGPFLHSSGFVPHVPLFSWLPSWNNLLMCVYLYLFILRYYFFLFFTRLLSLTLVSFLSKNVFPCLSLTHKRSVRRPCDYFPVRQLSNTQSLPLKTPHYFRLWCHVSLRNRTSSRLSFVLLPRK